ncbi:hypothetical protein N0V83_006534 [Neocucurbitaria cava]|uniref:Pre-mRNA polyadenylation factor Fip1 domain-containing protein n=1 Tax=Neocucurbitaria cava TaxID=798079 RepID=A0A9W9CLC1_9PLEO|nr:hypothetical protein N0V83_006534 [Neocucurbitaria cava]
MADDSDDDLYGEATLDQQKQPKQEYDGSSGDEPMDEGQDSGDEEEDDDSESDLEIIIDKPAPVPKPAAPQPQENKAIKIEAPPQTSTTTPSSQAPKATQSTTTSGGTVPQLLPGTSYPAQRTSTIDVNGNPVYPPLGKQVLSIDMEADMAEEQKIWRRPGEDQSDYFNYGFDEFSWEMYRQRQVTMQQTLQQQKLDVANMQQMIGGPMGGMASMGSGAGQAGGGGGVPTGAPTGPGVVRVLGYGHERAGADGDDVSADGGSGYGSESDGLCVFHADGRARHGRVWWSCGTTGWWWWELSTRWWSYWWRQRWPRGKRERVVRLTHLF